MLTMFKDFLNDEEASDMFVTGQAGTGKTTDLASTIQYCIDEDIPHVVCAFTHKACTILSSKLPEKANIQTLHKFLKKRPTINVEALKMQHVESNKRMGGIEVRPIVMFVDEYSMVGEKDFCDIQEEELKVVWLGDPNQLPPVGDVQAVYPYGKYQVRLTKIYRQAKDNPLIEPLSKLVRYIEHKEDIQPLKPNSHFIRGVDLVEEYTKCKEDKVLLAYTNKKVQDLNARIAGRTEPVEGDEVFSPVTRQTYTFMRWVDCPHTIDLPFTGTTLSVKSKYKTLETLHDLTKFALVEDEEGQLSILSCIFGHETYKKYKEKLQQAAVQCNLTIERANGIKASRWCAENKTTKEAKSRAKAWKDYLSFKDCCICLDFPYAMTIHKSQGSTYDTVFIDMHDLAICQDVGLQLKLMYVALSRASNKVYTS